VKAFGTIAIALVVLVIVALVAGGNHGPGFGLRKTDDYVARRLTRHGWRKQEEQRRRSGEQVPTLVSQAR
jgi:hypothetical protein